MKKIALNTQCVISQNACSSTEKKRVYNCIITYFIFMEYFFCVGIIYFKVTQNLICDFGLVCEGWGLYGYKSFIGSGLEDH